MSNADKPLSPSELNALAKKTYELLNVEAEMTERAFEDEYEHDIAVLEAALVEARMGQPLPPTKCPHGVTFESAPCTACEPECTVAVTGNHAPDDEHDAHCVHCGSFMPETRTGGMGGVKPCPVKECVRSSTHDGLHERKDGFMWLDEDERSDHSWIGMKNVEGAATAGPAVPDDRQHERQNRGGSTSATVQTSSPAEAQESRGAIDRAYLQRWLRSERFKCDLSARGTAEYIADMLEEGEAFDRDAAFDRGTSETR